MTGHPGRASLAESFGRALEEVGARDPNVLVLDEDHSGATSTGPFRGKYPDRFVRTGEAGSTGISVASELARAGRTVYAVGSVETATAHAYPSIRETVCYPRANVKIVGLQRSLGSSVEGGAPPVYEDIGLMRGLPAMTVVVPADALTARTATFALHERAGPAYLRLAQEDLPNVSDGSFQVGRAAELRPGSDLTIVAIGSMVSRALEVAEDLQRVGVSTRVLDFASVKPFDEPALLRAARDTGAILVLEHHSVLTGVGALVASTTSENYPVPVRRVGVPDVFVEVQETGGVPDPYGLGSERVRDEAWELLRLRGKVQ